MTALGTRLLTVTVGGTEYSDQVTDVRIKSRAAEGDSVTFAEARAGGGRVYSVAFKMTQDNAVGSLWDRIWSAAGTTVPVVIRPAGNVTASAAQPHYSGNVTIVEPDGDLLGGEADSSTTARWFTEVEWDMTAKPTKVTS